MVSPPNIQPDAIQAEPDIAGSTAKSMPPIESNKE